MSLPPDANVPPSDATVNSLLRAIKYIRIDSDEPPVGRVVVVLTTMASLTFSARDTRVQISPEAVPTRSVLAGPPSVYLKVYGPAPVASVIDTSEPLTVMTMNS